MATNPNELLAVSASLARSLAPELCRKDPVSGEDCSWYHGLWQDLRLLGLAASLDQQSDFFTRAFARFSGQTRPLRLLISGSADYSILAHVLSACSKHGLRAKITIIDLCETPLFFNRWYAGHVGCDVETIPADIFNYNPETRFDVICSHGFLSQFPPTRRAEIVRQWSCLLAPNGTALTVNRVRSGPAGAEIKFSEEQGREFCEAVAEKLRQAPTLEEAERAAILARVKVYVHRLSGYSLPSEELTATFQQSGFRLDDFEIVSTGSQDGKLSGPSVPGRAQHACLIASHA